MTLRWDFSKVSNLQAFGLISLLPLSITREETCGYGWKNVLFSLYTCDHCFDTGTGQCLMVEYGGGTRCGTCFLISFVFRAF